MRLFVALRLPPAASAHAEDAVVPVRSRHPDLRWVPAARWHLTLAFYGEVPDADLEGTIGMLDRRLAGADEVTLRLAGAGQFTRRAVWLGVVGEVDGLRRLARSVTFQRRPFRPHLTVARLRGGVDGAAAAAELEAYVGPAWSAGTVHLVRSRLGAAPTYEDMASWPLAPRP